MTILHTSFIDHSIVQPEGLALSVKRMLGKHEDLISVPSIHVKCQVVAYSCNPSTGEVELGESLGLDDSLSIVAYFVAPKYQ